MTHCLGSCCSLISSSLALAAPEVNTTAAPKKVLARTCRIVLPPFDVDVECADANQRGPHGTVPLGRVFGSVSQLSGTGGLFFSRVRSSFRKTPVLPGNRRPVKPKT